MVLSSFGCGPAVAGRAVPLAPEGALVLDLVSKNKELQS